MCKKHDFDLRTHDTDWARHSFKYTIGAQSNSGLDQVLYYDNLGWADERKILAEDDGGNTNLDNYNEVGVGGRMDEDETRDKKYDSQPSGGTYVEEGEEGERHRGEQREGPGLVAAWAT